MTPEGRVKDAIKEGLMDLGIISASKAVLLLPFKSKSDIWRGKYHMPVSNGMGVHGIPDFYGHYRGFFFEIEAKAPGGEITPRQHHQLHATEITGGAVFVIDRPEGFQAFVDWTRRVDAQLDA